MPIGRINPGADGLVQPTARVAPPWARAEAGSVWIEAVNVWISTAKFRNYLIYAISGPSFRVERPQELPVTLKLSLHS